MRKSGLTQVASSAKAAFSERTGRSLEKSGLLPSQREKKPGGRRPGPLEKVWEPVLVPLLKENPQLNCRTLLDHLEDLYPGQYPDSFLRSLQRRTSQWRALHGDEQEVMFRQRHLAGRQGLSDFTTLKGIQITIAGKPFPHLLYHFRLAYSGWSWMRVVQGGESFSALSQGLQDALWRLGGSPAEHRTDSLSAGYKNLSADDCRDITRAYKELCQHYEMTPTRNNRGKAHENGSIESPHGHLKRRLEQALLLRKSYDFESVEQYQAFIETAVHRYNRSHQTRLEEERSHLKELPQRRTIDFTQTTCRVTTSSTITVHKVLYTVPPRLIGYQLRIHIYDDRLSCYLGKDHVLDLPHVRGKASQKARCINYRHLIGSLSRKPQAFRYSILRDDLLPSPIYRQIWQHLDKLCSSRQACKTMVGILKIAADYDCEDKLGNLVLPLLIKGKVPCIGTLQKWYQPEPLALSIPSISVNQHSLEDYDHLLPSFPHQEVGHA